MKYAFLIFCFSASLAFDGQLEERQAEGVSKRWSAFKENHGKQYKDAKEESTRKAAFLLKDRIIQEHNSKESSYKLAHNHLSDLTDEEFSRLLGAKMPESRSFSSSAEGVYDYSLSIPNSDRQSNTSLDLRTDKCLSPVKDQGQCGSCWTFSVICPLEFASCKKKGVLNVLSEQQIVDCDTSNWACNGGWPTAAYDYLKKTGGSDSSSYYPYKAVKGTCKFSKTAVKATLLSYTAIPVGDVTGMENALKTYGPLSVIILVQGTFGQYASGVWDDPACPNTAGALNHAVAVVGFGQTNGIPYWIVRNSWGSSWGNGGYILMRKGTNLCNIERYALYVQAAS